MSLTSAKVLLDSINPAGNRLTTFELKYPRIVHAEFMTHRALSRNAASSRAIPTKRMIDDVLENPFVPDSWGSNQKGMQAGEDLSPEVARRAEAAWLRLRDVAVATSIELKNLGVHKQLANRPLETFQYITVIASGTCDGWANFFHLRAHEDAQPQIQELAFEMAYAYGDSVPRQMRAGEWHVPMTGESDAFLSTADLKRVATGRLARISYLTHDGQHDPQADAGLHDRLVVSYHWSPFEHVAEALATPERSGNFTGWKQYRKEFAGEFRSQWP